MNKYGSNLYFNERPEAMLLGYTKGDPLKQSMLVVFPVGETPRGAAEQLFSIANQDNRPNGFAERSMSVGDVVRIIGATGDEIEEWWFACEVVGFRVIPNPFDN